MQKIIDTHIHIWDVEKVHYAWLQNDQSILNQTWRIEQLEDERKAAGITNGLLVQAGSNMKDTDLMLQIAIDTDWIDGVVGWLPLTDTNATAQILTDKLLTTKYFKGVRHQIHDEEDTNWLLQPAVLNSLAILAEKNIPFDVVAVLPAHIEAALKVAQKIPTLKMVFDHLSQPPNKLSKEFSIWCDLMKTASQHKNFYAKISGLGTTCQKGENWTTEDIKPSINFVLQNFGTDRCFCGGDWPVALLAGSYSNTWNSYKKVITALLNDNDSNKVFYSNAAQFYNL